MITLHKVCGCWLSKTGSIEMPKQELVTVLNQLHLGSLQLHIPTQFLPVAVALLWNTTVTLLLV